MSNEDKSMTLWQIDAGIAEALESICDEDGVVDEEAEKRLEALEIARPLKLENCALFIKNRRAMAKAIRAEELALADRRRRYEADAERVEGILAHSLAGERFETSKVLVRWRSSQTVEVDEGAEWSWTDDDASRFIVYEHRIDKQKLKKALKAGEEIYGARLVDHQNMSIEGVQ